MWEIQKHDGDEWVVIDRLDDQATAERRRDQLQEMFPEWNLRTKLRMG